MRTFALFFCVIFSALGDEVIEVPADLLQNRRVLQQMIQASADTERLWRQKQKEAFAERGLEVLGNRKSASEMGYFFNYFSSESGVCGFEAVWNLVSFEARVTQPYFCYLVETSVRR
jgi:hypothetical protein